MTMKPLHLLRAAAAIAAAFTCLLAPVVPGAMAAAKPAAKSSAAKRAAAKPAASQASTVLARIGADVITLADLDAQIAQYPEMQRSQFQTPEAKRNVLDRMIQERVWIKSATAAGFDRKPEIASQIRLQTSAIILRGYFADMVTARAKASDEEVEQYYDSHKAEYTTPERVAWRHILVPTEKAALAARAEITKGLDFEAAARKFSTDAISRDAGGWLGYINAGGVPPDSNAADPALAEAAFKAPVGEVSQPIRSSHGWHLIKVDQHDPDTVRPIEGVRSAVEFKISNERSQALYTAMLDSLKTAFKVTNVSDTTKVLGPPTTVLASINGQPITVADLDAQIAQYPEMQRAQFQTAVARNSVVDRMVQERVWLRSATLAGYDKKADVKGQLDQQRNSIILRGYFNDVVVGRSKPGDEEIAQYYAAHLTDYTSPERVSWRHILLPTQKAAVSTRAQIAKGLDFEEAAKKFSTDPLSKASGGWLGYLTAGGVAPDSFANDPKLSAVAFTLGSKQVSDPVQSPRGWHILQVDQHDSVTVRPLEGVRTSIEFKISNERSQDLYTSMLDSLKVAYGVKVVADSAKFAELASGSGITSADEMFKLAQETQDAQLRLKLYQRVIDGFPANELAAQAQFMIGFVSSEELKDYDAAEKAFQALIARYPKSDLVDDAEWMLKNMRNPAAPDSPEDPDKEAGEHEHDEHEGHDHK